MGSGSGALRVKAAAAPPAASQPSGDSPKPATTATQAPLIVVPPVADHAEPMAEQSSLGVPTGELARGVTPGALEVPSSPKLYSDGIPMTAAHSDRKNHHGVAIGRATSKGPQESSSFLARVERKGVDPETRTFLVGVIKKHFIFSTLEDSDLDTLFDALGVVKIEKGEVVIQQGDVGEYCYFIRSGTFVVSIDGKEVKQLGPSDTFGELALLYQVNRTASVLCAEAGELWQMGSGPFRQCLEKVSSTQTSRAEAFFQADKNFCGLPEPDMLLLSKACSLQRFSDGEIIMREGEVGEWMFIIISGKAIPSDERLSHVFYKLGCVLGSLGLMYGKRQPVGARAKGNVECLALSKSSLGQLTDRVEDVLRRCAFKDLLHCLPRNQNDREFFRLLTEEQKHSLISTAEDAVFELGEVVVSPGDAAQLVVVIDGELAICPSVDGPFREDGDLVFVDDSFDARAAAQRVLTDGMGYGAEAEFLDGSPMSMFAIALGRVRVHRITQDAALASLGEPIIDLCRMNEIKAILQDIFLFKNLSEEQIALVISRFEQKSFKAGEVVVRQGDPAKHFFLIQSGTIVVKKGGTVVRNLGRWDYFGERGILLSELRSATCQSVDDSVCLSLDADAFFQIVGMFRKELERRMHLQDLDIKLTDLKCKAVVGRGTFGVVRLVYPKSKERALYALKCVHKMHIVKNGQEQAIVMERDVNAQCYHPCIMQFIKTFQDKSSIYFLTEFLGGGDLFYAIRQIGALTKAQSQYFSGSIALGLEYLHGRGIMYRDLKPENVLLDFQGTAKLVDFGCCKQELRTATLIGTPEYMAPEVIAGKGYTCTVDWWSLGVMLHEFIVGPLPFGANTDDQVKIFSSVLKDPLVIPDYVRDADAVGLLRGMLEKDPQQRAGFYGASEIKEQAYYSGFKWDALAGGFFEPPWKPDAEALMKNWEPPDGDLMSHVSTEDYSFPKGMEWARAF